LQGKEEEEEEEEEAWNECLSLEPNYPTTVKEKSQSVCPIHFQKKKRTNSYVLHLTDMHSTRASKQFPTKVPRTPSAQSEPRKWRLPLPRPERSSPAPRRAAGNGAARLARINGSIHRFPSRHHQTERSGEGVGNRAGTSRCESSHSRAALDATAAAGARTGGEGRGCARRCNPPHLAEKGSERARGGGVGGREGIVGR